MARCKAPAADRQAILDSLQEKLKSNPKSLVGNKGYRKYLKLDRRLGKAGHCFEWVEDERLDFWQSMP